MKAEIGYITAWRRAIFFTVIADIVVFGLSSSLSSALVGPGIITNAVSVGVLILCAICTLLVIADKADKFRDIGSIIIEDGELLYNDKKRHIRLNLSDIKKVDIEKIYMGRQDGPATAYRILIAAGKKKYYIESDRACGRQYNEMGINEIYLYIMEHMNK